MILKYKPDKIYRHIYGNKKIIYCRVIETRVISNLKCYKVIMINYHNMSNILMETELEKLNIIDKIKLLFIGGLYGKI